MENMMQVPYRIDNDGVYHEGIHDSLDSLGWQSKACFYFEHVFNWYHVPDEGDVVQIGCSFGCSLQVLTQQFSDRVVGIDPWNPLGHPAVIEKTIEEMDDMPVAFVHCNAGDFRSTPQLRLRALQWSLRNLVHDGFCLTAGNHGPVEESLGFKVADVAKDYGCVVEDIPDAIAALTDQKFPVSDCIIIKE